MFMSWKIKWETSDFVVCWHELPAFGCNWMYQCCSFLTSFNFCILAVEFAYSFSIRLSIWWGCCKSLLTITLIWVYDKLPVSISRTLLRKIGLLLMVGTFFIIVSSWIMKWGVCWSHSSFFVRCLCRYAAEDFTEW